MENGKALKASLIVSIYDNLPFLMAVLETLQRQTCSAFEIIISEDGEHPHIEEFLRHFPFKQPWKHLTQPDLGWRKNKALNRAVEASSTNYLIFIDGDCLLHPRFVEMHVSYATKGYVLGGKRLKLDPSTTQLLLDGTLSLNQLFAYCLKRLPSLQKNGLRFLEEGLFLSPNRFLGFLTKCRTIKELRGCNMSFFKSDLLDVNGFDEDYTLPAVGEDADITWRFLKKGLRLISLRNLAVEYHLYHREVWDQQNENLLLMKQKMEVGLYRCENGIVKSTSINSNEK